VAGQKAYFECLVNSLGSPTTQGLYIGFLRSAVSLVGGFDFCFRIFGSTQGNYESPTSVNDGTLFTTSTNASGDVICIAYDDTAKLIWARLNNNIWNNSGSADPATGVGGFVVSITGTVKACWSSDPAGGTASGTARFASASWGFIAPVGYSQINA
jgi:hypothetical protein